MCGPAIPSGTPRVRGRSIRKGFAIIYRCVFVYPLSGSLLPLRRAKFFLHGISVLKFFQQKSVEKVWRKEKLVYLCSPFAEKTQEGERAAGSRGAPAETPDGAARSWRAERKVQ